jgi:L-alanine-DL-glutamate epimerase-like enolase superfamily enzyme
MNANSIRSIEARLYTIPLPEILSDAKHGDHTHFELVTVTVTLHDGQQGTGYTYTGGKGGHAIQAMVRYDLAPALIGKDAPYRRIFDFMDWHVHYVGRGGIAAFYTSAIDIALWDIRCRHRGFRSESGRRFGQFDAAYCGGIDLGSR